MSTEARHPNVYWAQREDRIFLTIDVFGVQNAKIDIQEDTVSFTGQGDSNGNSNYAVKLELYDKLNKETSTYSVNARNITFLLLKAESGPYWPRLLKATEKPHFLKIDFDHWKDEDEEIETAPFGGFGGMGGMEGMGGMGGMDFSQFGGMGGGMEGDEEEEDLDWDKMKGSIGDDKDEAEDEEEEPLDTKIRERANLTEAEIEAAEQKENAAKNT